MSSPSDFLFAEKNTKVWAILDGASVESLLDQLHSMEPEFVCLYRGELEPDIAEVAPYLVRLDPHSAFTDWVLQKGWGQHWGIFLLARSEMDALRRHLRRFLTVHDPEGAPLLFRYYDPRVLRAYLPTCNAEELTTVFGPVACYMAEGEDPTTLVRFQFVNGELVSSAKELGKEVS